MMCIQGLSKVAAVLAVSIVLTACVEELSAFPQFKTAIQEVALEGYSVPITLKVGNDSYNVACFSGATTLSPTGNVDEFSGVVDQGLLEVGENIVACEASNASGRIGYPVGVIIVLENGAAPSLVASNKTVSDGNGNVWLNIDLIDSGENLVFPSYSLAPSSDALPSGLSVDASSGNIKGFTNVVGDQSYSIVLRASTLAGSGDSAPVTLTITDQ